MIKRNYKEPLHIKGFFYIFRPIYTYTVTMSDNFDLRKYLIENKATINSRMLSEEYDEDNYDTNFATIEELLKDGILLISHAGVFNKTEGELSIPEIEDFISKNRKNGKYLWWYTEPDIETGLQQLSPEVALETAKAVAKVTGFGTAGTPPKGVVSGFESELYFVKNPIDLDKLASVTEYPPVVVYEKAPEYTDFEYTNRKDFQPKLADRESGEGNPQTGTREKSIKLKLLYSPEEITPEELNIKGSLDLSDSSITSLPDNLKVRGNLDLRGSKIKSLPDNLQVGGYLDVRYTKLKSLPGNLKVGGSLNVDFTKITSFPEDLQVRGRITTTGTPITTLPDNFKVGENLLLAGTKIASLPDNLQVGGVLDLGNTPLQSIPGNLKVGDDLYLHKTQITSLPKDLQVGGTLWLNNTPISKKYTKEELKEMLPYVNNIGIS